MKSSFKISANIVCKDERYWIEPSIRSIAGLVDEIIYVDDNSIDGTLEIVSRLAEEYDNIKVFSKEEHGLTGLGDMKNFAKNNSRNELVLRWDGDFIAYDSISSLFKFAIDNSDRWDAYVLNGPNLEGDINHSPLNKETFGPECYLFKKDAMEFKVTERYNDYPEFKENTRHCYPGKEGLNQTFFFIHMHNLKSLKKLAYRKNMSTFQNYGSGLTYWKFVNPEMTEAESISKEIESVKNHSIQLKPFDFERWGEHPSVLTDHESSNMFKIHIEGESIYLDNYPES